MPKKIKNMRDLKESLKKAKPFSVSTEIAFSDRLSAIESKLDLILSLIPESQNRKSVVLDDITVAAIRLKKGGDRRSMEKIMRSLSEK
jgi:hypothetical protein